jgi:aminoglycoside phosphotransferase (APT) family kinase protein
MLDLKIIGQGATTTIYRDGSTAIKLYVNVPLEELENEAVRQRFALNAGLPVPEVYGIRRLEDNAAALDMAYIDGKPLMRPKMDKTERNKAIQTLVILQCKVQKIYAGSLPKQKDSLLYKIKQTELLSASMKENLESLLTRLDNGLVMLCHGDFHPLNVLYDGNKHWIIDWVDATAGDPLADACRTYLIFRQYASRSAGIYLKTFCKESKSEQCDVLAWLPVIAAARLSERMDDKSISWLLGLLREWDNNIKAAIPV